MKTIMKINFSRVNKIPVIYADWKKRTMKTLPFWLRQLKKW